MADECPYGCRGPDGDGWIDGESMLDGGRSCPLHGAQVARVVNNRRAGIPDGGDEICPIPTISPWPRDRVVVSPPHAPEMAKLDALRPHDSGARLFGAAYTSKTTFALGTLNRLGNEGVRTMAVCWTRLVKQHEQYTPSNVVDTFLKSGALLLDDVFRPSQWIPKQKRFAQDVLYDLMQEWARKQPTERPLLLVTANVPSEQWERVAEFYGPSPWRRMSSLRGVSLTEIWQG